MFPSWEVIRREGDCVYAVKTVLGWTVNGPLRGNCNFPVWDSCVQLWEQQVKADFPECTQDEQLWLTILVDGQYSIGLPLRQDDAKIPNNKMLAEQ